MNTISGENSRERSRIYPEQIVTVEDLNTLKADLLDEMRKLLGQPSDKRCDCHLLSTGKLSKRSVNKNYHTQCKEGGIAKKIRAHTLRHTLATRLLE